MSFWRSLFCLPLRESELLPGARNLAMRELLQLTEKPKKDGSENAVLTDSMSDLPEALPSAPR